MLLGKQSGRNNCLRGNTGGTTIGQLRMDHRDCMGMYLVSQADLCRFQLAQVSDMQSRFVVMQLCLEGDNDI